MTTEQRMKANVFVWSALQAFLEEYGGGMKLAFQLNQKSPRRLFQFCLVQRPNTPLMWLNTSEMTLNTIASDQKKWKHLGSTDGFTLIFFENKEHMEEYQSASHVPFCFYETWEEYPLRWNGPGETEKYLRVDLAPGNATPDQAFHLDINASQELLYEIVSSIALKHRQGDALYYDVEQKIPLRLYAMPWTEDTAMELLFERGFSEAHYGDKDRVAHWLVKGFEE